MLNSSNYLKCSCFFFHQTTVGKSLGKMAIITAIITQQNAAKLQVLLILPPAYAAVWPRHVLSTVFHLKKCLLGKGKLGVSFT